MDNPLAPFVKGEFHAILWQMCLGGAFQRAALERAKKSPLKKGDRGGCKKPLLKTNCDCAVSGGKGMDNPLTPFVKGEPELLQELFIRGGELIEMSIDKTTFKKVKIEEVENDFRYWQTQSYEKRLATLESIRNEYIEWKYGTKREFQRVYSIIKQKLSGYSVSPKKVKMILGKTINRA